MILSTIEKIWNLIVLSNTFNFVLFIVIFAWIFKKIKMGEIISSIQEKVVKIINEVKKSHEDSKVALSEAQKAVENLEDEIKVIAGEAEKSAEIISNRIMLETSQQLSSIGENTKKVIAAEEKLLISNLTKSTSLASVEKAKNKIQNILVETPSLQIKYINESIDELDRLNF